MPSTQKEPSVLVLTMQLLNHSTRCPSFVTDTMIYFSLKALIALSLSYFVASTPLAARYNYAVKNAHPVPARWSRLDRAPNDQVIQLSLALEQSNFKELEHHLYEGSLTQSFLCEHPSLISLNSL